MNQKPRKRLGQHFLHDRHVIDRIVDAIRTDELTPIVEIGPGRGALTIPLLKARGSLDVIEVDRDLAELLVETCRDIGHLKVHIADVLQFDFAGLGREKIKIVGNLPYNISTPLLFHLLQQLPLIDRMVFMLQKEVVNRICAAPDCGAYGRLSVMVQARCQVEQLFDIPPGAFTPPPRVESSLLQLIPISSTGCHIQDPEIFARLVAQAFNQRRKTIRNSLKELVDEVSLARAGIDATVRAENLTVTDYINLANFLHDTHRKRD